MPAWGELTIFNDGVRTVWNAREGYLEHPCFMCGDKTNGRISIDAPSRKIEDAVCCMSCALKASGDTEANHG